MHGEGVQEKDIFGNEREVFTDDLAEDMVQGSTIEDWSEHCHRMWEAYSTPLEREMAETDHVTQAQERALDQQGVL